MLLYLPEILIILHFSPLSLSVSELLIFFNIIDFSFSTSSIFLIVSLSPDLALISNSNIDKWSYFEKIKYEYDNIKYTIIVDIIPKA